MTVLALLTRNHHAQHSQNVYFLGTFAFNLCFRLLRCELNVFSVWRLNLLSRDSRTFFRGKISKSTSNKVTRLKLHKASGERKEVGLLERV